MIRKIDRWPYWARLFSLVAIMFLFAYLFGFGRLIGQWHVTPAVAIILYKVASLFVILGLNWVFLRQKVFYTRLRPATMIILGVIWLLMAELCFYRGQWDRIPAAIIIGLVAAVTEELQFRGMIFGSLLLHLSGRLKRTRAVVISALFFAGAHLTNMAMQSVKATLVQMMFAFGLGLILAVLYQRSGTLLAPMALHFSVDYWSTLTSSHANVFSVVTTYRSGAFTAEFILLGIFIVIALLVALVGRKQRRDRLTDKLQQATALNFKVTY
ncbi:CPBP family intramembrane metalloprotease [Lacticaseibacillus pabuli]|uniref:CPBP family intramembrane metalloprotease n=1 Tax=Lacticaseibacillus pabuli TaxID=3025672 RepID=A0ABY7WSD4_9LACO|nr:CPBP family intramembrane glutamic endopeptidase [Lacticaseibacillus sp. KACC 23028]WDF81939.1 CPBP family intramembrane metalloprotease [Lacticaseibacillus sp. KACC 23028]